jgi:hypothetical protein
MKVMRGVSLPGPRSSSMMSARSCAGKFETARCSPAWSAGRGNFLEAFHHRPFGWSVCVPASFQRRAINRKTGPWAMRASFSQV